MLNQEAGDTNNQKISNKIVISRLTKKLWGDFIKCSKYSINFEMPEIDYICMDTSPFSSFSIIDIYCKGNITWGSKI